MVDYPINESMIVESGDLVQDILDADASTGVSTSVDEFKTWLRTL